MNPADNLSFISSTMPQSEEARRLLLRIRRHQLLAPLHAILELSRDLLAAEKIQQHEQFRGDVQLVHDHAEKLRLLITDLMSPEQIRESQEADFQKVLSRIDHKLRNLLTVLIGYSEDLHLGAPEKFLDGFRDELEQIQDQSKHLNYLLDEVVAILRGDLESSPSAEIERLTRGMLEPDISIKPTVPGTILIVDDDPVMRSLLEQRVLEMGHRTETVADGILALELLQREPEKFDLVLLDLVMPRASGYEVLAQMKRNENLQQIPVLVVSGLGEQEEMVRCIVMGAEDFLPKPFNRVLLRARIQACLEKKRLRDEAERERKRYDELLHDILPGPIVDALATNKTVPPQRHENVAVLFADLVGFTTWCDRQSPESVVGDLQQLFIQWEDIANSLGVQKIKTIGDAFMAASGLLVPVENSVKACVECGFQMIRATQKHHLEWNLRVGVHVGPVVSAVLGKRQYLYDLWGDTVNTAARMESNGRPGHVNMTLEAWGRVVQFYGGLESWEILRIKGKGAMQVLSLPPDASIS